MKKKTYTENEINDMLEGLREDSIPETPADLTSKVMKRIRAEETGKDGNRGSRGYLIIRRVTVAVASLVLVVGVLTVSLIVMPKMTNPSYYSGKTGLPDPERMEDSVISNAGKTEMSADDHSSDHAPSGQEKMNSEYYEELPCRTVRIEIGWKMFAGQSIFGGPISTDNGTEYTEIINNPSATVISEICSRLLNGIDSGEFSADGITTELIRGLQNSDEYQPEGVISEIEIVITPEQ